MQPPQTPTISVPRNPIENVTFEIVEKNEQTKSDFIRILHEYPNHFVQGLFESIALNDCDNADLMLAYEGGVAIGCLTFNRNSNEFNWLAVSKSSVARRSDVARKLFESFYPVIRDGVSVHFYVNSNDASIEGVPSFNGASFDPARALYRSMGWTIDDNNLIRNFYGKGSHVHRVEWVPNLIE